MSRSNHMQMYKCNRYDYNTRDDDYSSGSEFSDGSDLEYSEDSEPVVRPTMKRRDDYGIWNHRPRSHSSSTHTSRQRARPRVPVEFPSLSTIHSNISTSFETTNDTNEDDLSDLYTPIERRGRRTPPRNRCRGLSMIQEISPVMPSPRMESCDDLPKIPPLGLYKEWRPQQTSTTTSLQNLQPMAHLATLPKTNPRYGLVSSTPRIAHRKRTTPVLTSYNQVMATMDRPKSFYGIDTDTSSSYYDKTRSQSARSIPDVVGASYFRPENFGVHAAFAKNRGLKGILFLTMTLSGSVLTVTINRAVYFLEPNQPQICSYVRAELRYRDRDGTSRKRSSSRSGSRRVAQSYRTSLVATSNRPEFNKTFQYFQNKKMLGCMSFPVSRIIKKARETHGYYGGLDENMSMDQIVVNDGGFFLLDEKKGERTNMPQQKIRKTEYYDDPTFSGTQCGLSTASSSMSNLHSPTRMRSDDLPLALSRVSSSVPGYSDIPMAGGAPLDYSSASSSTNSHEMYSRMHSHRATLPSITTKAMEIAAAPWRARMSGMDPSSRRPLSESMSQPSSPLPKDFRSRALARVIESDDVISNKMSTGDTTSDFDGLSCHVSPLQQRAVVDQHFLFADPNQNDRVVDVPRVRRGSDTVLTKDYAVRRAASFTYSPKGALDKHNRRPSSTAINKDEDGKKRLFGPISKTISYIRSKMDTALSTGSLYPSREEVQQWENCFEALLNHKFGCSLFRQFLKKEFSDENVDFWLECEEFKRMKDGKKTTLQRAHEIYREFVAEQSPKEVNLDSDTRAATKAALENGCKLDTFSLAQSRIEQLMEKDSYRRFLKDPIFLSLLEETNAANDCTKEKEKEKEREK